MNGTGQEVQETLHTRHLSYDVMRQVLDMRHYSVADGRIGSRSKIDQGSIKGRSKVETLYVSRSKNAVGQIKGFTHTRMWIHIFSVMVWPRLWTCAMYDDHTGSSSMGDHGWV